MTTISEVDPALLELVKKMDGDQHLVVDRHHLLKTHRHCFPANEAISWLVNHGSCETRQGAVETMDELAELGLVHHVYYEHAFSDAYLFFQFSEYLHGWHTVQAGWLTSTLQRTGLASWYVLMQRSVPDTGAVELKLAKYSQHGYGLELHYCVDLNSECTVQLCEPTVHESARLAC